MAALLRSGKFLRMVSGISRNVQAATQSKEDGSASGNGILAGINANGNDSSSSTGGYHNPGLFQSIQSLHNALPYVAIGGDKTDKDFTSGDKVSKEEVEELIRDLEMKAEICPEVVAKESVSIMKLCGKSLLKDETPQSRTELVQKVMSLLGSLKIELSTHHYNALLQVYLENDHKFCPESIQNEMRQIALKPDKETYQCLLWRYCQDGNTDGIHRVLKNIRQKGYAINENICNSLIIGHSEAGDIQKSKGVITMMMKHGVEPTSETFKNMCFSFAKVGDIKGIQDTLKDYKHKNLALSVGDYFDIVNNLVSNGHKDHVGSLTAFAPITSESYSNAAQENIDQWVKSDNDDVAFTFIKTIPQTDSSVIASNFLKELVSKNFASEKLIEYSKSLEVSSLVSNGKELILESALTNKNLTLALRASEAIIKNENVLSENFRQKLFNLSLSSSNDMETVETIRLLSGLSKTELHDIFERQKSSENIISFLDKIPVQRSTYMTTLTNYFIENGNLEEAKELAQSYKDIIEPKIVSKLLPKSTEEVKHVTEDKTVPEQSAIMDQTSVQEQNVPQPTMPLEQQPPAYPYTIQPTPMPPMNTLNFVPMVNMFNAFLNTYEYVNLFDVAEQYYRMGNIVGLEQLMSSSGNLMVHDRKRLYLCVLKGYVAHRMFDKAVILSRNLHIDGMSDAQYLNFPEFNQLFSSFSQEMIISSGYPTTYPPPMPGSTQSSTPRRSYPSTPAPETDDQSAIQALLHRKIKKAIAAENIDESVKLFRELDKFGKVLNVTESSTLIEQLVKSNRINDATEIATKMLARDAYPLPKIFRFLLNRLASLGEVGAMNDIGQYLNQKVKKEVSFDNRLCNAYLASGRGSEFLELLQNELDKSDEDNLAVVQERFPRGGAMGLLESEPELVESYSKLAQKFAETGYVAPMNVLWTYHFINNRHDEALELWDKYVKNCPQIMFQKVCQTARSSGNTAMAERLVALLHNANVTSGAKGIAYSCLLDCLSQSKDFSAGMNKLKEALSNDVKIEDINRTALVRLKKGAEEVGEDFPFEIPKKSSSNSSDKERSLTPVHEE